METISLPAKEKKRADHLTLRVPHELMQAVREFRRLAKERQKDSSLYLQQLIEVGVKRAIDALKGEAA